MKKKNVRILVLIIVNVIMLLLVNRNVYAINDDTVSVTSEMIKNNVENNIVEVKLNIMMKNMSEGINAYTGKIKYNTEQLKLIEIKGLNGWNSPTYKDKDGEVKVAATNSIFSKDNGEIFIAKFEKIKEETDYEISFENLEVATKINGKAIKVLEGKNTDISKLDFENSNTKNENILTNVETDIPKQEMNLFKPLLVLSIVMTIIIVVLLISFGFYQKGRGGKENAKDK